jgi:hypothetical protein
LWRRHTVHNLLQVSYIFKLEIAFDLTYDIVWKASARQEEGKALRCLRLPTRADEINTPLDAAGNILWEHIISEQKSRITFNCILIFCQNFAGGERDARTNKSDSPLDALRHRYMDEALFRNI